MSIKSNEIWSKFSDELRGFVASKINNKEIVDDILHTIFVKIHSNIETLKNQEKIRGWIYRIAKTTIIDYYREELKRKSIRESDLLTKEDVSIEANEVLARGIRSIIQLLPADYAQAIYLTEYEGLTQTQLAEKLGLSVSGAKSRVQRARFKVKELLLQFCHIEFDIYGTVIEYDTKHCSYCTKKTQLK